MERNRFQEQCDTPGDCPQSLGQGSIQQDTAQVYLQRVCSWICICVHVFIVGVSVCMSYESVCFTMYRKKHGYLSPQP